MNVEIEKEGGGGRGREGGKRSLDYGKSNGKIYSHNMHQWRVGDGVVVGWWGGNMGIVRGNVAGGDGATPEAMAARASRRTERRATEFRELICINPAISWLLQGSRKEGVGGGVEGKGGAIHWQTNDDSVAHP